MLRSRLSISLSQPSSYFDDLLCKILPTIKVITSKYFLQQCFITLQYLTHHVYFDVRQPAYVIRIKY